MKATGIIRRTDDLGRIVIAKDIRRQLNIQEGDAFETFIEDGCVIFKPYKSEISLGIQGVIDMISEGKPDSRLCEKDLMTVHALRDLQAKY